ncbi:MAG: beta-L-arabinofuranosidase domain-containing protein [Thermoguttaceae bacterium]
MSPRIFRSIARRWAPIMVGLLTLGLVGVLSAADRLTPIPPRNVEVGGEIGRRIRVTIDNNLLALDADKDFLPPFANKNVNDGYIGLGKLIDAAVRLAAYSGDERVVRLKDHLVDSVISSQEPDGYPGILAPGGRVKTLWDVHEVAYLIYGLCSDYEFFHRDRSLLAARAAADYVILHWHEIPDDWGLQTGVATHVAVTGLERAMLALARLSGDARYLDFCRNERNLADWDLGIVMGRRPLIEGHMYAYLCRSLAQLELYRVAPDERLLRPSDRALEFLTRANGMAITGGGGQWEIWTDDQDARGALAETCATAYQIRWLSSRIQLEGQSRYGDLVERAIYNSLFAAQSPDGRQIRYYTPIEGPRKYHPGDTYCCPCNYRRIVAELPTMVYYRCEQGLAVNLYTPSEADVELSPGLHLAIRQETDYPNSGHVVLRVDPARPAGFTLQLRLPAWCPTARVAVNDEPARDVAGGVFLRLERSWKPGDCVRLDMPMPWRLVRGRQRQAGRVAVMRGPLVFCLNPQGLENLAAFDGADLGQITLDPKSLAEPVSDASVRPDGLACAVDAWIPGYACSRPGNLKLRLTEFPDPNGQAAYFRLQDLAGTEDDELLAADR